MRPSTLYITSLNRVPQLTNNRAAILEGSILYACMNGMIKVWWMIYGAVTIFYFDVAAKVARKCECVREVEFDRRDGNREGLHILPSHVF